jgi:tetratricopeptide (TPR) repeat protein
MARSDRAPGRTLAEGLKAHKAGDLDTADQRYTAVLRQAPDNVDALHLLGLLRHQRGGSRQAVELLRRAAELRPGSAAVAIDLGTALAAEGQLDAAESAYRRGVECDPDNPLAHANLGRLLLHRGRPADAVGALQSAVIRAPRRADLLDLLAQALEAVGRVHDAAQALTDALRHAPGQAHLWSRLGGLRRLLGDRESALSAHQEAVRLQPESPAPRLALGEHHQSGLRLPEAEEAYQAALARDPTSVRACVGLAEVRQMQGRFAAALAHAKQALTIDARDPGALLARAEAERCAGELDAALNTLAAAEDAAPGHPGVARAQAIARFDDRAPQAAYDALVRLADLTPQARPPRFQLALLAGWLGWQDIAQRYRRELADLQAPAFILDSVDFALANRAPGARLLACPYATLAFALDAAPRTGLVIDLGVFHAASTNFLAERTDRTVYGFDSFEGLPEAWGQHAAGAYSVGGRLPDVRANVDLRAGWFEDTLPDFAAERPAEEAVALVNVDCDIYSSTKTALDALADRITDGTVLVFDEYFATASWREDEHRALMEAAASYGWTPRYLAFNGFSKQAVVRIAGARNSDQS